MRHWSCSGQIGPLHEVSAAGTRSLSCVRPVRAAGAALFLTHPVRGKEKEGRTMKSKQILIAASIFGLVSPSGAIAATLCVGKDYASISVEQRSQLETELRKKGGLKSGDQLAPCDRQTIGATRSASSKKKADPKQANSCKKDCDTVSGVAEAVCLIPALAAACIIVKPALKTVCPAACEAQHARSSSSRVQLWNASFRSASDGGVPPPEGQL